MFKCSSLTLIIAERRDLAAQALRAEQAAWAMQDAWDEVINQLDLIWYTELASWSEWVSLAMQVALAARNAWSELAKWGELAEWGELALLAERAMSAERTAWNTWTKLSYEVSLAKVSQRTLLAAGSALREWTILHRQLSEIEESLSRTAMGSLSDVAQESLSDVAQESLSDVAQESFSETEYMGIRAKSIASKLLKSWSWVGFSFFFFLPTRYKKQLGFNLDAHASEFFVAFMTSESRIKQNWSILFFTIAAINTMLDCTRLASQERLRAEFDWVASKLPWD